MQSAIARSNRSKLNRLCAQFLSLAGVEPAEDRSHALQLLLHFLEEAADPAKTPCRLTGRDRDRLGSLVVSALLGSPTTAEATVFPGRSRGKLLAGLRRVCTWTEAGNLLAEVAWPRLRHRLRKTPAREKGPDLAAAEKVIGRCLCVPWARPHNPPAPGSRW